MSPVVFMAGGGTGGHVFPMVAVAHAIRAQRPDVRPIFVGTSRGMETRFVPEQGFDLLLLDVLPIRGGGVVGALKGAGRAVGLLPRCRELIREHRPRSVFSIGGYAAGPVSLAARTLGLPVALMEPNSVIGLSNLLLAPFVDRAYTAFDVTEPAFEPAIVRSLGVPLRPGFSPQPLRFQPGAPRVLVLGGSQGAKSLNEAVPDALLRLRERLPGLRVVHQCGKAHTEAVLAAYRAGGREHDFVEVTPFLDDMQTALARADLVVSRSGASAVSEIAAMGRPSVLVPYPFASGDHQRINAEVVERAGAGVCIPNQEATSVRLFAALEALLTDDARLRTMALRAAEFGRPNAARDVARDFLELSGLGVEQGGNVEQGVAFEPGSASPGNRQVA